jgi:hypothetical protein
MLKFTLHVRISPNLRWISHDEASQPIAWSVEFQRGTIITHLVNRNLFLGASTMSARPIGRLGTIVRSSTTPRQLSALQYGWACSSGLSFVMQSLRHKLVVTCSSLRAKLYQPSYPLAVDSSISGLVDNLHRRTTYRVMDLSHVLQTGGV